MEQRSDRAQSDHVRRGEDRIEIDLPRDQRIDRGLGEFDLEMRRDDQRRIDRQPSLLERTQIALIPLDDLGRLDNAQERDPVRPPALRRSDMTTDRHKRKNGLYSQSYGAPLAQTGPPHRTHSPKHPLK